MPTTWTVALDEHTTCGHDGHAIAKDQPVQEIRLRGSSWVRKRCVRHAIGVIDEQQVEQARLAAEARTERQALADQAPAFVDPRTPFRVARPKAVKSFASLADVAAPFDPKAAAAADRD